MAKPIFTNGWYFCGEHTNSKYRGTVHGALLSGRHASGYIQDGVNENQWKYADRSWERLKIKEINDEIEFICYKYWFKKK